MSDGINETEKWQWVDEDPIERLLGRPKSAGETDSPAPLPQSAPVQAATVVARVEAPPVVVKPVERPSTGLVVEAKDSAPAFGLAVSLEKAEKWDEAASAYRKVLEIEPDRVDASIGLGACLLHLDNAADALNCFENCLSSNMARERALLGKAVALQKLTRNDEADVVYRELLQITPNAAEPLANLIALSVARQDGAAVGDYSRRLLQIDPHSKAALQGLATEALWTGDMAAAIGYCKRVVEVDPVSYEGWFNLGYARQNSRLKAKAVRSIA